MRASEYATFHVLFFALFNNQGWVIGYRCYCRQLVARTTIDEMSTDYYLTDPPTGQIRYGLDHAPTLRYELIVVGVVTTLLSAITLGLRLFTRIRIVPGTISADDCKSWRTISVYPG